MKGDFTRSTFKHEKQYSGVRMQQGRVQLDADWNEQNDINSSRIEKEARDIIGPCGAPQDGGGFKIDPKTDTDSAKNYKNLTISPGSIYVDGILCENLKETDITGQDDQPGYQLPSKSGVYLAYLDVWQRHMTAIEDPEIREVALGGPDTATRTKTVWQVKLNKLEESTVKEGKKNCDPIIKEWENITKGTGAELIAFTNKVTTSKNPCIVPPGAGYRGLENQLYRVEIHTGGELKDATFKWSRDNGSVIFAIEEFVKDALDNPTNKLKVKQLGKDKTLSLKTGDWVEVLDDVKELSDDPAGKLVNITEPPDLAGRIITLSEIILGYDMTRHPKIRRWDMGRKDISVTPPPGSDSIELENGIFVRFSGTSFRAGDYWLIPARTATGDIEWPKDETKTPAEPISEPPEGIRHHYCRLALLQLNIDKTWSSHDCRKLFPAVTELTSFFHVCGDGQEAMPGEELPEPLQVGVSNGKLPVNGALVKFEITEGGGILSAGSPVSNHPLVVKTGSDGVDGVAKCTWTLGVMDMENMNIPTPQLVKATLLDVCGNPINIPLCFNANLSVASEVAYKPPGCTNIATSNGIPTVQKLLKENVSGWPPVDAAGNTTVKDVLDTLLCKQEAREIPYNPTKEGDRWKDINEVPDLGTPPAPNTVQNALDDLVANLDSGDIPYNPLIKENRWKDINEVSDLGTPPAPNTVQNALDDLVENLDSGDIPYAPPNCGMTNPTVWSLLNISAGSNSKVKDILDALLCTFDATDLPIQKNSTLCKRLKDDASVKTVQDALNALCNIRGGCCVFVDDEEHLKKALSELKDGGVICLLAGEFKLEAITIEGLNNIVIRGCTITSRLISDINIVECKNVVIENLDISGNIVAKGVDGLSLRKNNISLDESRNLDIISCTNVRIEKNSINSRSIIYFYSGNDIELFNNTVDYRGGTRSVSMGILALNCNQLKIRDNRLNADSSVMVDNQLYIHIDIQKGRHVEISGNYIQTKISDSMEKKIIFGVEISDFRILKGHVLVNNNTIDGSNGWAIYAHYNEEVRILGNNISGSFGPYYCAMRAIENVRLELLDNNMASNHKVIEVINNYVNTGRSYLNMGRNRIETSAISFSEDDDKFNAVVYTYELTEGEITGNQIKIADSANLSNESVCGLYIVFVNGFFSVNRNRVDGLNKTAIWINQLIGGGNKGVFNLQGNLFNSVWYNDYILSKKDWPISNIHIFANDISFIGNRCALTVQNIGDRLRSLLKEGGIPFIDVLFDLDKGNVTATGNRCIENLVDQKISSISAPSKERAILLGNITTNKIIPEPDPLKLNLRG